MAPHSSTLAWKIQWTEEPGRLQSMGSLRVGHNWETSLSLSCFGEGNGNPLQCSCLENLRDGVAWWAAVYRVTQSQTRLKRLSIHPFTRHLVIHLLIISHFGNAVVDSKMKLLSSGDCILLGNSRKKQHIGHIDWSYGKKRRWIRK